MYYCPAYYPLLFLKLTTLHLCEQLHSRIHMHTLTHTHTHSHTHTHTHTLIYTYTHTYTHTHTLIYTYTLTHTHIHTHTLIYTHTLTEIRDLGCGCNVSGGWDWFFYGEHNSRRTEPGLHGDGRGCQQERGTWAGRVGARGVGGRGGSRV